MVLERDRPLVEPRVGIARRVHPVDDGDPAEVLVGDAVRRHVALGMQRDPRRGRHQSERCVIRHEQRCLGRGPRGRASEAEPRPFVERAIAHDTLAAPVATAIAACTTVPAAAPPPWCTRVKKVRSPMPRLRAISISSLESIVNVTMPSTSPGCRPASSIAALTASQASWSSLRPDSFENSVCPIPAIAALPLETHFVDPLVEQTDRRCSGHVVTQAVRTFERDLDQALTVGARRLPVTAPVKRSGSSGKAGTPRRMDSFLTIASGPAQSVRNVCRTRWWSGCS